MSQRNGLRAMPKKVTVSAPARVHITLIDLTGLTGRMYGGVGFALTSPRIVVSFEADAPFATSCASGVLLDHRSVEDIHATMSRFFQEIGIRPNGHTRIDALPPSHTGLGTKTALLLGLVETIALGLGFEISQWDLIRLSGRGSTSGVGIHSYFEGGVIFDIGQPAVGQMASPSSAGAATQPSSKLVRLPFPPRWKVALLLPNGSRYCGPVEQDIFTKGEETIPEQQYHHIMASVYHGLAPSFMMTDLVGVARALRTISNEGFKHLEIGSQPPAVSLLISDLLNEGYAAGMSSMGPLVYAIFCEEDGKNSSIRNLQKIAQSHNVSMLSCEHADNRGRIISWTD